MHLPISNRLLACCSFINQNDRVADIGCDHGYLGIHLLLTGKANAILAADIKEMPLESARRNSIRYGVGDKMRFYLSDGARNIPRDFDALVCAGMGGDTMMHILSQAPWLQDKRYRLILQCQSRRPELRQWLYDAGFRITRETLAQDGKFYYPVMEVIWEPGGELTSAEAYLTPALLQSGSPLLPAFYERVKARLELTAAGLARSGDERLEMYQGILQDIYAMEGSIYGDRS